MTDPRSPTQNLIGTTAIVTGANSGIGLEVTRSLAAAGAHVVMAVRDAAKGRQAAVAVDGSTEVRVVDLSERGSVEAFAEGWDGPIDLLINNAGTCTPSLERNSAGYEMQFATNHLGPFALTNLLLPSVNGRIVTVASRAERQARINLDDLHWDSVRYSSFRAYANSKLANLLFTSELQRRLDATGSKVQAMAAHPGFVATGIYDQSTRVARLAALYLAQDARAGAEPVLLAALGDLPGDTFTGPQHLAHMRGGAQVINRSKTAQDRILAHRLWTASEALTGAAFTL